MTVSVFSKNWYRVEFLTPRLKPQVEVSAHEYRGERWYLLRERLSGATQRFSKQAYSLIGLMDGEHSLGELWEHSANALEREMPTQDEVIHMVSSLYQQDMLQMNVDANARDFFERQRSKTDKKWLQKIYSPLSIQVPLYDPTRALDRIMPVCEKLLNKMLWIPYLLLLGWAGSLALQHFDGLTNNLSDRVLAADNLLLLWLLYPVIKIIHEFGHAITVRHYGGQVHEMGVMFLVLLPMPYVNASESASFENKHHRMLVSLAGILVELFIAAVALILWTATEEGLFKSILFNIIFMAGVSTVLFNGNPLLKFDAYFVLSDFLEIPNLAKKGLAYWGYLTKKYAFGIRDLTSPAADYREAFWLFFYHLLSFCYRLFISITIVLFVGDQYFFVGVLLAIWALGSGWVIPFFKTISKPFMDPQFKYQGRNPFSVVFVGFVLVAGLLFALPAPYSVTTEGVLWTDEDSHLYAGESGFIAEMRVQDASTVSAGDVLITVKNHELKERYRTVQAQLLEARARYQSLYQDRSKSLVAAEEITRFEQELKEVGESLDQLNVTAHRNGKVVYLIHDDMLGRFLKRGELVGYVLSEQMPAQVKALVPEGVAEQVLKRTQSIDLRSASRRSEDLSGRMLSVVPKITKQLPNPVLAEQFGGAIVVNPSEEKEATAVENYLALDIAVEGLDLQQLDERFYVRFTLEDEPLFWRFYRAVRRVLLEYFET